jgi:hypothetical protein
LISSLTLVDRVRGAAVSMGELASSLTFETVPRDVSAVKDRLERAITI